MFELLVGVIALCDMYVAMYLFDLFQMWHVCFDLIAVLISIGFMYCGLLPVFSSMLSCCAIMYLVYV